MTEFDKVIPPGGVGKVTASIDTARYAGPVARGVKVTTNDPAQETVLLTLKVDVVVAATPTPGGGEPAAAKPAAMSPDAASPDAAQPVVAPQTGPAPESVPVPRPAVAPRPAAQPPQQE